MYVCTWSFSAQPPANSTSSSLVSVWMFIVSIVMLPKSPLQGYLRNSAFNVEEVTIQNCFFHTYTYIYMYISVHLITKFYVFV